MGQIEAGDLPLPAPAQRCLLQLAVQLPLRTQIELAQFAGIAIEREL